MLDDAPAVLVDPGVDDLLAGGPLGGHGGFLVGVHEPGVPSHVCGEDGGQPTFRTFRFHRNTPSGWPAHQGWSNGKFTPLVT